MSNSDDDRAGELLLQEVDEDLRHEQYTLLWKRYGHYVVAVVLALIIFVAGFQGWQGWQARQRQQDSAQLQAAQVLANAGKTAEAAQTLADLAAKGHAGYAVLAQMDRAQLLGANGDTAGALAAYEQLAASSVPAEYRDLAVLKAALLSLDQADPGPLEMKVSGLTTATNPWRYSATEVLALIAQKKGDVKRATDLYKQLADDPLAPQGIRTRAAQLLAALAPPSAAKPAEKAKG